MSTKGDNDGLYDDVLTSHSYDGIQEFDNPMPAWWTWIFVGSCIWAGVYVVGINLNFIPDYQDDLQAQMEEQREIEAIMAAEVPPLTPEMLARAIDKEGVAEAGESVFTMNCAACHGTRGEGQIGPNLTDNAWLHGNDLADIHRVIEEGVPSKGMPAWGPILQREDMIAVIAYVETLRGTDIEGKAPEGEVYADEPKGEAPDEPGEEPAEQPADGPGEEPASGEKVDVDTKTEDG